MATWYEVLIASSVTAWAWMWLLCGFDELLFEVFRVKKLLIFFSIAFVPTLFFQARNTTFPLKKKGFFDGDEQSSGFWFFMLILNTALTCIITMVFAYLLWATIFFYLFGFEAPNPL